MAAASTCGKPGGRNAQRAARDRMLKSAGARRQATLWPTELVTPTDG
jgi:hypothetical protein